MRKFNKLVKMVKAEKDNEVASRFIEDLKYTIEKCNESNYIPTRSYKPSGMSACNRSVFYEMSGVRPDVSPQSIELVGICESGTDRHEAIQDYIENMRNVGIDCDWVDVGKFITESNRADVEVLSKVGNETKLYSKKYNMRFMCDGLVKYKGEYYIIEIKTESTHKFNKHNEPHNDHKVQGTCYSVIIGVPKVIFIYENRDNCSKKAYLFEPSKHDISIIDNKVKYINTCVEEGELPPRELDKCMYCKYKSQCEEDGY